jgi:hypothetical protein
MTLCKFCMHILEKENLFSIVSQSFVVIKVAVDMHMEHMYHQITTKTHLIGSSESWNH